MAWSDNLGYLLCETLKWSAQASDRGLKAIRQASKCDSGVHKTIPRYHGFSASLFRSFHLVAFEFAVQRRAFNA
jgi:hypothetical protein